MRATVRLRTTSWLTCTGYAPRRAADIVGLHPGGADLGAVRHPRRELLTWIVGVTAVASISALVLGRDLGSNQAVFLGISLAFTLLFVLASCRARRQS